MIRYRACVQRASAPTLVMAAEQGERPRGPRGKPLEVSADASLRSEVSADASLS